jgi:hypothetical protein
MKKLILIAIVKGIIGEIISEELKNDNNNCVLNFLGENFSINFYKNDGKFSMLKKPGEIKWILNKTEILKKTENGNLEINSKIKTDYLKIEGELKNRWILIKFQDFQKLEEKEKINDFNLKDLKKKRCSANKNINYISFNEKFEFFANNLLKKYDKKSFSFKIELQFDILGNWKDEDVVNIHQNEEIIFSKNYQICGKEIFKNSCIEKGIDICDYGFPALINQKIFIFGNFQDFSADENLIFKIEVQSENQNKIDMAINFFLFYIKIN